MCSSDLAIPFFDACLALRLPDDANASGGLKLVAPQQGWLAALLSETAVPAAMYEGDRAESMWLPDERVAKAWSEYVKTGAVSDSSPPTKPHDVAAKMLKDEEGIELRWNAVADFESGLQRFIILRDGQELATAPKQPVGRFGRALFQTMSYHDTPEKPLPEMRFVDATAKAGEKHTYQVIAVNSVGSKSEPSTPVSAP